MLRVENDCNSMKLPDLLNIVFLAGKKQHYKSKCMSVSMSVRLHTKTKTETNLLKVESHKNLRSFAVLVQTGLLF